MARITTTITYLEIDGDYGPVEGIELTCDECGFTVESAGTHEGSIKRCAFLLREGCPRKESNFYETD
jgi:hypothetical protein